MESTEDMKVESITPNAPDTAIPSSEEANDQKEIPTTRLHECSDGKHRNEEQYQSWKIKKAQFDKDSDMFCHVDDIIMGEVEGPRGRAIIFGHHPIEQCKAALCTLQHRFFNALTEFEFKMEMKSKEQAIVGVDGKPVNAPKPSGIIT